MHSNLPKGEDHLFTALLKKVTALLPVFDEEDDDVLLDKLLKESLSIVGIKKEEDLPAPAKLQATVKSTLKEKLRDQLPMLKKAHQDLFVDPKQARDNADPELVKWTDDFVEAASFVTGNSKPLHNIMRKVIEQGPVEFGDEVEWIIDGVADSALMDDPHHREIISNILLHKMSSLMEQLKDSCGYLSPVGNLVSQIPSLRSASDFEPRIHAMIDQLINQKVDLSNPKLVPYESEIVEVKTELGNELSGIAASVIDQIVFNSPHLADQLDTRSIKKAVHQMVGQVGETLKTRNQRAPQPRDEFIHELSGKIIDLVDLPGENKEILYAELQGFVGSHIEKQFDIILEPNFIKSKLESAILDFDQDVASKGTALKRALSDHGLYKADTKLPEYFTKVVNGVINETLKDSWNKLQADLDAQFASVSGLKEI